MSKKRYFQETTDKEEFIQEDSIDKVEIVEEIEIPKYLEGTFQVRDVKDNLVIFNVDGLSTPLNNENNLNKFTIGQLVKVKYELNGSTKKLIKII